MKKSSFSIIGYLILTLILSSPLCAETPADFDGDGKTDLVVYRRDMQDGRLYWYSLNSIDNNVRATQWGYGPGNSTTSDLPVLRDFDGDGKTDIGVFRTAYVPVGTVRTYFYILRSRDSTVFALQWGLNADHEISQDYDGDGKADAAVARSTLEGMIWYINGSRDGFYSLVIPGSGFPISGDYDGDGKADAALIRISGGSMSPWNFTVRKSSTGQIQITPFGNGLYYAVPGDYDGDGKTDIALWGGGGQVDGENGVEWIWIRSSDGGIGTTRLGASLESRNYPVQGDYDGDGKTDPAIYRQGNNSSDPSYFLIRGTQSGFYTQHWGRGTDGAPLYGY